MKLQTATESVKIVGGGQASNFTIAANGKAFRVLSDTLYSDKIGSIVREICCNAYDAHVMAGVTDRPFEVHIPDDFEPWFSVKDYGVGLSPEDIVNVFTVYFQSTKDQSNDAIGAFGLGAKTPFSYTDQFTVTSVYEGQRTIYSAFISESGLPSIVVMHTESSTEENGVEVKMSVKREDYRRFHEAMQNQLRFFKVKPVFNNGTVNFKDEEYIFESKNARVGKATGYSTSYFIVQGNVGYPLDTKHFDNSFGFMHVELLFDIGEIGVTASREAVEYDETTKDNIRNKLEVVRKELQDFFSDKIQNLTNYDKVCEINSHTLWQSFSSLSGYEIDNAYNTSGKFYYHPSQWFLSDGRRTVNIYTRGIARPRFSSNHYVTISPSKPMEYVYVVKDTSSSYNKKVEVLIAGIKTPVSVIVMIEPLGINGDEVFDELKARMPGCDSIYKLSQVALPKVDRTKPRVDSATAEYYISTGSTVSYRTKQFDPIEDIEDEFIYVEVSGYEILNTKLNDALSSYKMTASKVTNAPKLLFVPTRNIQKAKDNPNLTHIDVYLDNLRNDISSDPSLKVFFKRENLSKKILSAIDWTIRTNENFKSELIKSYPRTRLARLLRIYNKVRHVSHKDSSLAYTLGIVNELGYDSVSYSKFDIEKIKNLHSMVICVLQYSAVSSTSQTVSDLVKYVAWSESKTN